MHGSERSAECAAGERSLNTSRKVAAIAFRGLYADILSGIDVTDATGITAARPIPGDETQPDGAGSASLFINRELSWLAFNERVLQGRGSTSDLGAIADELGLTADQFEPREYPSLAAEAGLSPKDA